MPSFRTTRRVRHSAQNMFDLVTDVEAYPQFVPLCTAMRLRQRTRDAEGVETLLADMEVGYKAIRERFTSRVVCDRANLTILVDYVDGPFSRMKNRWVFRDQPGAARGASTVEFFIDYEFKSRVLGLVMGSMFDTAFRRFSAAFERRADEVYGRPGVVSVASASKSSATSTDF
ncbi:MAG: type II toxin-antitoxin system RatA family toxin [Methylobacteriaceae bacterium]|nr:type II toxin-antitoxin system RatA family toxin [Methylobacteriaceae bacterium]